MNALTFKHATCQTMLLAFAGLLITVLAGACSSNTSRVTRVAVTGETNMKAQPDAAVVVLSVITQGAQAFNARKSDAVIHALQASAGANPEIKTSDYCLRPQYDERYNKLPKIIGYEARNSVMVTMSDLSKVGAVIDAASRAGANSVENVSFILRDNSPARGQALAEASRQAMNKAQSIAQSMGGHVVRVVEEQEAGAASAMPEARPISGAYEQTSVSRMMGKSTPVESGPLSVNSRVQLVVEIEAKL